MEKLRQPLSPVQIIIIVVVLVLIVAGFFFWRARRQQAELGPPPGMEVPAYPLQSQEGVPSPEAEEAEQGTQQ